MKKMNNIKKILVTMLVAVMLISNIPVSARRWTDYSDFGNDDYYLKERVDHELWHKAWDGYYYRDLTQLETTLDVWGTDGQNIDWLDTYLGNRNDSDVNDKTRPYSAARDLYIKGHIENPICNEASRNIARYYEKEKKYLTDSGFIGGYTSQKASVKLNKSKQPVVSWKKNCDADYMEIQRREFIEGLWTEWKQVAIVKYSAGKYTDKDILNYEPWERTVQYSVRAVADSYSHSYIYPAEDPSLFSVPVAVKVKKQSYVKFVDAYFGMTTTYSSELTKSIKNNAHYENQYRDLVIDSNGTKVTYKFVSEVELAAFKNDSSYSKTNGKNEFKNGNTIVYFVDTKKSVKDSITKKTSAYYIEVVVSGNNAEAVAKKANPTVKSVKTYKNKNKVTADLTLYDGFGKYYAYGYRSTNDYGIEFTSNVMNLSNDKYVSTGLNGANSSGWYRGQKYTQSTEDKFYANPEIVVNTPYVNVTYSYEHVIGGKNTKWAEEYAGWTEVTLSKSVMDKYTLYTDDYGKKAAELFHGKKFIVKPEAYKKGNNLVLIIPVQAWGQFISIDMFEGLSNIDYSVAMFMIISAEVTENITDSDVTASVIPSNIKTFGDLMKRDSIYVRDGRVETVDKNGNHINTYDDSYALEGDEAHNNDYFANVDIMLGNGKTATVHMTDKEMPDSFDFYDNSIDSAMNIFKAYDGYPKEAVKSKEAFIEYTYQQMVKSRKTDIDTLIKMWVNKRRSDGDPVGLKYVTKNHPDWLIDGNNYKLPESVAKELMVRAFYTLVIEEAALDGCYIGISTFDEFYHMTYGSRADVDLFDNFINKGELFKYSSIEEALANVDYELGQMSTLLDWYLMELYW